MSASSGSYPENHKYTIYREPQWWHHAPDVPKVLAGCQEVNARAINVALFRQEAPELVEQYIQSLRKGLGPPRQTGPGVMRRNKVGWVE